jgi:signal transduction protein with GAF and PtsI domain
VLGEFHLITYSLTSYCSIAQLTEANRTIEELKSEKQEIETRSAKQTVQLANLATANEALSAKASSLATKPDSAHEISELRQALKKAEDEIENIRNSEVAQQLQKANLLDELNTMQNDNAKLREQLRAEQRKQK